MVAKCFTFSTMAALAVVKGGVPTAVKGEELNISLVPTKGGVLYKAENSLSLLSLTRAGNSSPPLRGRNIPFPQIKSRSPSQQRVVSFSSRQRTWLFPCLPHRGWGSALISCVMTRFNHVDIVRFGPKGPHDFKTRLLG